MGCDLDEGGKILVSGLLSDTDVSLPTSIPYPGWYSQALYCMKNMFSIFWIYSQR